MRDTFLRLYLYTFYQALRVFPVSTSSEMCSVWWGWESAGGHWRLSSDVTDATHLEGKDTGGDVGWCQSDAGWFVGFGLWHFGSSAGYFSVNKTWTACCTSGGEWTGQRPAGRNMWRGDWLHSRSSRWVKPAVKRDKPDHRRPRRPFHQTRAALQHEIISSRDHFVMFVHVPCMQEPSRTFICDLRLTGICETGRSRHLQFVRVCGASK